MKLSAPLAVPVSLFATLFLFLCAPPARADTDITSGSGTFTLPAGGGTAVAARDVVRDGERGPAVYGPAGNGFWTVRNFGSLTNGSGDYGVLLSDSNGGTVHNAAGAAISVDDDYAVSFQSLFGGGDQDVALDGFAVLLAAPEGDSTGTATVWNEGTIIANDDYAVYFGSPLNGGGPVRVLAVVAPASSVPGVVTNRGTIIARGNYGIRFSGDTDDLLVNSGRIQGDPVAVDMGSGNDRAILQAGSTLIGVLDGGDGTDTLRLEQSGTLDNTVQNFETLQKTESGLWGISTDLEVDTTNVEGGELGLNTPGTLTTTGITVANGAELSMQGGTLNAATLSLEDGSGLTWNGGTWNVNTYDFGVLGRLSVDDSFVCPVNLSVNGPVVLNDTLTVSLLNLVGGSTLQGNGQVNGSVVNSGTLAPGNSIGTLVVTGNYTQNGGAFEVELSPDGRSDKLIAYGSASFNGTRMIVVPESGTYTAHSRYEIVSGTGGVNETFTGISAPDLSHLLYLDADISSKSIVLEILRRSYTLFAETGNQLSVADVLDEIENAADGDLATVLNEVDYYSIEGIALALEEMSPAESDAFAGSALEASRQYLDSISRRINALHRAERLSGRDSGGRGWRFWARGMDTGLEREGTGQGRGFESDIQGMSAGADKMLNEKVNLGFSLGTSTTEIDWENVPNEGDIESLFLGAYVEGRNGPFYVNTSFSYGSHENEGTRRIQFGSIDRAANLDYDSNLYALAVHGGYGRELGAWTLDFLGTLSYLVLDEDGYAESGAGALDLNVEGRDVESFQSALGVRISKSMNLGAARLVPSAELNWVHEFEDDARTMKASFTDYPSVPFTSEGLDVEADRAELGLGLSALFGERTLVFAGYRATFEEDARSDYWTLGAGIRV